MTALIRTGTVGDHPQVVAMAVRTLGSDYQVHSRRQFRVTDEELLLAYQEGELVGFLTLEVALPSAEILAIATVAPRRGVGTALMAEAERVSRTRGCDHVSVVTTDKNETAHQFYAHLGYAVTEVLAGAVDECRRRYQPNIPMDAHDEIRFERTLEPLAAVLTGGPRMKIEQINGTTLCHHETGRGEPLVLVHGGWVDQTTWDAVVPALAETFRVVTYDERGHGRSRLDPPNAGTVHDDVADLAALIEHLDLEPVNVAGISSGACIALRLASERPALVRRVLPHEPPCMQYLMADVENKPALDHFGETIAEVQHQIEAGDHRGAGERFFDTIVGHPWSELSNSERDLIAAHAVPFLGQMHDPDAIALDPDALRSVSAPVLLSDGEQSPRLLRLIVDELATVMPNVHRNTIADAGHVPHMTHPDAYVEMVLRFVRST